MYKNRILSVLIVVALTLCIIVIAIYNGLEKRKININDFVTISGHSLSDSDFINKVIKFNDLTYTFKEYEELTDKSSGDIVDKIYTKYGVVCIDNESNVTLIAFDVDLDLENTDDKHEYTLDFKQYTPTPFQIEIKENNIKTFSNTDAIDKIKTTKSIEKSIVGLSDFNNLENIIEKYNIKASTISEKTYTKIIASILNGDTETYNTRRKYFENEVLNSQGLKFIQGHINSEDLICGKSDYKLAYFDRIYTHIEVDNIQYSIIMKLDSEQMIYDIDILNSDE